VRVVDLFSMGVARLGIVACNLVIHIHALISSL
jgi:hypothetical protein